MEMAFSVLAGTVFGYVLDEIFETAPVLTIVFLFVGLVGGVVAFVKLWTRLEGEDLSRVEKMEFEAGARKLNRIERDSLLILLGCTFLAGIYHGLTIRECGAFVGRSPRTGELPLPLEIRPGGHGAGQREGASACEDFAAVHSVSRGGGLLASRTEGPADSVLSRHAQPVGVDPLEQPCVRLTEMRTLWGAEKRWNMGSRGMALHLLQG